jgi:hypothetical protein
MVPENNRLVKLHGVVEAASEPADHGIRTLSHTVTEASISHALTPLGAAQFGRDTGLEAFPRARLVPNGC